jgi:hypothetical protein
LPVELLANAQAIANLNETNLVEMFFDLEAELEKGTCRDEIAYSSNEREQGWLCWLNWSFSIEIFSLKKRRIIIVD